MVFAMNVSVAKEKLTDQELIETVAKMGLVCSANMHEMDIAISRVVSEQRRLEMIKAQLEAAMTELRARLQRDPSDPLTRFESESLRLSYPGTLPLNFSQNVKKIAAPKDAKVVDQTPAIPLFSLSVVSVDLEKASKSSELKKKSASELNTLQGWAEFLLGKSGIEELRNTGMKQVNIDFSVLLSQMSSNAPGLALKIVERDLNILGQALKKAQDCKGSAEEIFSITDSARAMQDSQQTGLSTQQRAELSKGHRRISEVKAAQENIPTLYRKLGETN